MTELTAMDGLGIGIGLLGTGAVVGAFISLQLGWIKATGWRYNLMNLAGAIAILASLLVHFNLASFIIQLFWIGASLLGLYRKIRRQRRKRTA